MTPEQELIYFRTILLDKTKSSEERKNAQKKIIELCNLKEKDSDGECTPEKVHNILRRR